MAATAEEAFLDSQMQRVYEEEEATFSKSLALKMMEERLQSAQNFVPKKRPFMPITSYKINELAKEIDPEWNSNGVDSTNLFDRMKSELHGVYETLNDVDEFNKLTTEERDEIKTRMYTVIFRFLRDKRLNPGKFPIYGGKPAAFAAEVDTVASLRPEALSHKQIVDRATEAVMKFSDTPGLGSRALQSALNIRASMGGGKVDLDPKAVETNADLLLKRTEIPEKWRLTLARGELYNRSRTNYPRTPTRYDPYARPKKT